ncbi:uncharacterized protein BDV17DRAFT_281733 [Aspergillus undulatus]|uniref:uncharacterized protein n=1 Tax=Aspergillus undulatus TaxID=1810928 RepID=UPI003CCE09BA
MADRTHWLRDYHGRHLSPLRDIVQRFLSTQRAEYVFVQVAEGLSTKETARYKPHMTEPQIDNRTELRPGALDLVRSWRSEFNLKSLEIDANAVVMDDGGLPYVTDELVPSRFEAFPYHGAYVNDDIYPRGMADVVAFWAETHLYGGVVVFNDGESDTEFLDVLLHPDRRFRVFRMSDSQIDYFIGFGLYWEPTYLSPFPIKAERDAVRLMGQYTIYQNIYRRKNDRKASEEPPRVSCAQRMEGDPDMMEFMEKWNKGGVEIGEDGEDGEDGSANF